MSLTFHKILIGQSTNFNNHGNGTKNINKKNNTARRECRQTSETGSIIEQDNWDTSMVLKIAQRQNEAACQLSQRRSLWKWGRLDCVGSALRVDFPSDASISSNCPTTFAQCSRVTHTEWPSCQNEYHMEPDRSADVHKIHVKTLFLTSRSPGFVLQSLHRHATLEVSNPHRNPPRNPKALELCPRTWTWHNTLSTPH